MGRRANAGGISDTRVLARWKGGAPMIIEPGAKIPERVGPGMLGMVRAIWSQMLISEVRAVWIVTEFELLRSVTGVMGRITCERKPVEFRVPWPKGVRGPV